MKRASDGPTPEPKRQKDLPGFLSALVEAAETVAGGSEAHGAGEAGTFDFLAQGGVGSEESERNGDDSDAEDTGADDMSGAPSTAEETVLSAKRNLAEEGETPAPKRPKNGKAAACVANTQGADDQQASEHDVASSVAAIAAAAATPVDTSARPELKGAALYQALWTEVVSNQDLFRSVTSFLRPKSFLFVANISKAFYHAYRGHPLGYKPPSRGPQPLRARRQTSHLACLESISRMQWSLKVGLVWNDELSALAVKQPHGLTLLKWGWERGELRELCMGDRSPANVKRICNAAAALGDMETIKWSRQLKMPWDRKSICKQAAEGGHLEVLRWAREQDTPCPWNQEVTLAAATNGHRHILQYMKAKEGPWHNFAPIRAARNGHYDVVWWCKVLAEANWEKPKEGLCAAAAEGGHLKILEWAVSREGGECAMTIQTCAAAAAGGHLDVLKWIRERNVPWDKTTTQKAAGGGNLEVLKWAIENECPWEPGDVALAAAEDNQLHVLQWVAKHLGWIAESEPDYKRSEDVDVMCKAVDVEPAREAAKKRQEEITNDPELVKKFTAAGGGRRLLHSDYGTLLYCRGAKNDHLRVCKWARKHGFVADARACSWAAGSGNMRTLKWLRGCGFQWDARAPAVAAGYGHLNVLQWLRMKGCAWDESTTEYAAKEAQMRTMLYARRNGCPWTERCCSELKPTKKNHRPMRRWLHENGCPCSCKRTEYEEGRQREAAIEQAKIEAALAAAAAAKAGAAEAEPQAPVPRPEQMEEA